MPSQSETVSEKPHHYTYLKEFRTQQCPLFLQHKCTQHRPFVCFHWHFANQRRRRPTRKRDGTFNYSPDVYCTKYDETTGICPEGDDCPFLHRTAGDTERRYHLRYYKTCTCVYETDARGHCVKNGAHCAFAHGAADLRPPLYDVRELQAIDGGVSISESPLGSSLEKDRIINEDPRWNDTNYVLANYKTEPCKRPPRLCRQGYACPSFHNTRDRRRSPKKTKYRSTPCPNVKHGDDWGDPTQCESGDGCAYCHTRTEQQFHPEIYKSTKCNDMMQTGYCPRGPFCAFAHVEHEMTTQRDVSSPGETSLAAFVESALPGSSKSNCTGSHDDNSGDTSDKDTIKNGDTSNHKPHTTTNGNGLISSSSDPVNIVSSINSHVSYPEPIGKGRTSSMSSSVASDNGSNYPRAPGSEREDSHHSTSYQAKLRQQLQSIENDPLLDSNEKRKRKQNLMLVHNINIGVIGTPPLSSSLCAGATAMSPHAASFYPAGDTVESVIGNALEEDLNLGEISLSSLDREMSRDNDNDTNSVCSSLSAGFPANSGYLGATSVPVTIPAGGYQRNSLGSLSQSPSSSPVGSLPLSYVQKQEQQIHDAALAFLSQPNPGKFSAPASSFSDYNSMSPRTNGSVSQSPMVGSGSSFGPHSYSDIHRLREELGANKAKLAQWEEGISQARGACEAWKREAEEACRRAKIAEEDRQQAIKQRDEAVSQMAKLKMELDQIRAATILNAAVASGAPFLQSLAARASEMESLPQNHMKPRQKHIEDFKMRPQQPQSIAMKCGICQEKDRSINILPCNHFVLCNMCISKCTQCPMCQAPTSQPGNFSLPM